MSALTHRPALALILSFSILGALTASGARTAGHTSYSGQEARVTEVFLKADDGRPSGPCPATVRFAGYITTDGPGTVKYTFTRSDGATGPVLILDFKVAGTREIETTWTLGDATTLPSYEGWQAVKVLSPNELESSHETGSFVLKCGGGSTPPNKPTGNQAGQSQPGVYSAQSVSVLPPTQGETKTDYKKEEGQVSIANLGQTGPELSRQTKPEIFTSTGTPAATVRESGYPAAGKFADRKGARAFVFEEIPQAAPPLTEPPLQSLSPVAISALGRVKAPKVGNRPTSIDPSVLGNATRAVDPRLRGPNLSNTAGNSQDMDVAASGDNVYVVWSDTTSGNGDILLAISTDHGASFWPSVNLSNTPTVSRKPSIAAAGDQVYIIWEEQGPFSTGFFTVSTDGAESFSTPQQLDTSLGDTYEPKVVVSGGRGLAAWRQVERDLLTLGRGQESVRFRDLTARDVRLVARVPWHIEEVSLAAGGSNIYVTWIANFRGEDLDPYFSTSIDDGRTFRVDQFPEDQASPRSDYGDQRGSGVAASGNTFVWYYESNRIPRRTVYLETSGGGGAGHFDMSLRDYALNYSTLYPDPANEAFRAPMHPHFTLDGAGRFVGAWVVKLLRPSGYQSELHFVKSGRPISVLARSGNPREPRVAAQDESSLVVYVDDGSSGGARQDVFAYLRGDRDAAYNVSSNPGNSSRPKVVASGPNYLVVWTDDTPGNTEIFFRAIPAR